MFSREIILNDYSGELARELHLMTRLLSSSRLPLTGHLEENRIRVPLPPTAVH